MNIKLNEAIISLQSEIVEKEHFNPEYIKLVERAIKILEKVKNY